MYRHRIDVHDADALLERAHAVNPNVPETTRVVGAVMHETGRYEMDLPLPLTLAGATLNVRHVLYDLALAASDEDALREAVEGYQRSPVATEAARRRHESAARSLAALIEDEREDTRPDRPDPSDYIALRTKEVDGLERRWRELEARDEAGHGATVAQGRGRGTLDGVHART